MTTVLSQFKHVSDVFKKLSSQNYKEAREIVGNAGPNRTSARHNGKAVAYQLAAIEIDRLLGVLDALNEQEEMNV